jgi:hypothetical protein
MQGPSLAARIVSENRHVDLGLASRTCVGAMAGNVDESLLWQRVHEKR